MDRQLQFALNYVCGALGQGLSEKAAIRHASWWCSVDEVQLLACLRNYFPNGLDEERQAQRVYIAYTSDARSNINQTVDKYISKHGLNLGSEITLMSAVTAERYPNDSALEIDCLNDRLLYWKRKSIFYIFKAGRISPINSKPLTQ